MLDAAKNMKYRQGCKFSDPGYVFHLAKDDMNMPVLVIVRSVGLREYFVVEDQELLIGRSEDCEIFLNNGSVSRRHAKIVAQKGGFIVEDLGSKNGTTVNGDLITRGPVEIGDDIFFGDVKARLLRDVAEEAIGDQYLREQTFPLGADILSPDADHLRFLFDLMPAAPTLRDEKAVCKFAVGALLEHFLSDNVFVALYDNARNRYHGGFFRSADKKVMAPSLPAGLLQKATHFKKAMLLIDVRREMTENPGEGVSCALCVPMIAGGELQGLIYLDRDSAKPLFDQPDAALCSAMAATFATLIFMSRMVGHLRRTNKELKQKMEGLEMLGRSQALTEVREKLVSFGAKAEASVLILGETGTGRSLAARMIHRFSRRPDKPFLSFNCASLPAELVGSELFGHVRNAFPGADRDRRGLLELADQGALLLSSIDAMPLGVQDKLFRFLETGEFSPLGVDTPVAVKVRVIVAMAGAPADHIQSGHLREDLFFKLHTLLVEMPPLRERSEDIALLADHFLKLGRGRMSTPAREFSHAAIDKLKNYEWPGNVTQLQKVIDAALHACDGEMVLPEHILGIDEGDEEFEYDYDGADLDALQTLQTINIDQGSLQAALDSVEKRSIQKALERHNGDEAAAAAELDISVDDLKRKFEKFGIS